MLTLVTVPAIVLLVLLLAVMAIVALSGYFPSFQVIQIGINLILVAITLAYWIATLSIARSSEYAAKSAEVQARASLEMCKEMNEQRLAASRPMVIQKSVQKSAFEERASEEDWSVLRSDYFSHFVVMNVGNGPAIEVEVSLMDKDKNPFHSVRETYLRAGEQREFREFRHDLANRQEATYYLACEYKRVSSSTPVEAWDQTWLPFKLTKASRPGEMYITPGELEFKSEVPEKDRIDAFGSKSKPK
jgi:hypothetical protein